MSKRTASDLLVDNDPDLARKCHKNKDSETNDCDKEENQTANLKTSTTPEIVYENGFRRILPYYYQHRTHAKGRWVGKSLFSIFEKEFQDRPPEYYKHAIQQGHIQINGRNVSVDTLLQHNDLVTHKLHRHEPPVSDAPISILAESKDWLVINKPAGIPVHPSGRYHYNSILSLLNIEKNIQAVAIHRLDRLTSGVMLLSKNKDKISAIDVQFHSQEIQKEYLCKVKGKFPETISCEEPILPASMKLGVHQVHPEGKPCHTDFKRILYDGENSIVLALPRTGRTHQIRVHLKHLGFPIVNDPLYSNSEYDSSLSDVDIALLKKKSIDEKSTGACFECQQSLMPDPEPDNLFLYLHALRYSIKANLGLPESDFCHFNEETGRTLIQTDYPSWAKDCSF